MTTKTLNSKLSLFALAGLLTWCPPPARAKDASASLDIARQLNQAFIEIADKVSPAVVVVEVVTRQPKQSFSLDGLPQEFRDYLEKQRPNRRERTRRTPQPEFDAEGSGVVIRGDGYILTNGHVVDEAEKIRVRFKDGKEYPATVQGVDPQSDIAVIKIDAKGLTPAKLGDSAKTRVGEFAIAIGAPFNLDYSVTFGHVSGKGRVVAGLGLMDQDFIQTDASINPGNSGGPLVNLDGEVIGINSLIRGMNTGIGFAIPINLARNVADQLVAHGKFSRAWLGIESQGLREAPAYRKHVKGVEEGVFVIGIKLDGPAAKSELKPADVITAVEGKPVKTLQELRNEVRAHQIGQTLALDVVRNGKPMKIKLKTGEMPEDLTPVVNDRKKAGEPETAKNVGVTVQSLTSTLAEKFGVDVTEGVIVTAVEQDSPAAEIIKPGDIITEVNHKKVINPKQFRDALKETSLKEGVLVNLISDGTSRIQILKDSGD